MNARLGATRPHVSTRRRRPPATVASEGRELQRPNSVFPLGASLLPCRRHFVKKLRVLLADDHPLLCRGTQAFLASDPELEVCALAGTGREAVEETARNRPDVVVLDFHLPDGDALSLAHEIKGTTPAVELVVYSAGVRDEIIARLFEAGVKSFIRKTETSDLLIQAIKAAGQHRSFLTPAVSELIMRRAFEQTSHAELSPREQEVVRLIAHGKPNKQIAAELGISERTAESHRASVMRKLGGTSTADVVRYAIRNGIIEP